MKKRIISVVMALVLLWSCFTPAFAAGGQNDAVDAYIVKLEEKYGVKITYDTDPSGRASIGTGNLTTLDRALLNVTPQMVKQVSAYYKNTLGKPLSFAFRYSPFNDLDVNVEILGSFNKQEALIELYMPSSSKGTFITGDSPITILHEFGHAYYNMFVSYYGEAKMEKEWTILNDGVRYNPGYMMYAYNKVAFMSSYGATSLGEDFAELFSHAFLRHNDGQGFSHRLATNSQKTSLGKKLAFIETMLPMYLKDTDAAVKNLRRVYSAEIFVYYDDVRVGGEHLQYAGYAYPRYVLNGLLSEYGIKAKETHWIKEIGGWYVIDSANGYYLIFPGGYAQQLKYPVTVPAA